MEFIPNVFTDFAYQGLKYLRNRFSTMALRDHTYLYFSPYETTSLLPSEVNMGIPAQFIINDDS